LIPYCGLEVQKPTQALRSVKDQGNTLDLSPKSINIPSKYIKDGKVLDHLGFQSKILPKPLTDLSAWVDFCTSRPQQGVK
jgi:hypothetical protein